ncbi:hypothetical protein [Parafrankia discariae]|uniref:hypothetical protein n=1 Tax=Parafrankia discariae TaxID=365528 RepID=UPI0012B6A75D|nr:hypothetical protein [Parafrankia discariae]
MSDGRTTDDFRFVPVHVPEPGDLEKSQPFNLRDLWVVGTLAICDVDEPPKENTLPSISVKITQYIRLGDDSLIRLDMDRGFTASRYGASGEVSWARKASDLVAEILDLVRTDDEDDPDLHPWEELAEAAQKRGISVNGAVLRELPYQVLLTAEVIALFEL